MQNDLISRSKLLEEIQNWGGCTEALEEYIKKMPTAVRIDCCAMGFDDSQIEIIVKDVRDGGKE